MVCKQPSKVKEFLLKTENKYIEEGFFEKTQKKILVIDVDGQEESEEEEEEGRKEEEDEDEDDADALNFFDRLIYLFNAFVKTNHHVQYVQCLRIISNACDMDTLSSETVAH